MIPRGLIFIVLTLAMFGPARLWADFIGSYDEAQWTFKAYGGEGCVDWLGDSFLMDSGYSGSGSVAQAEVTMRAPRSGTFYFDWIFYGGTATGYRFSWIRNNSTSTIVSRHDYDEGHDSFFASAGDIIGFRVASPLDEFPAMVEVSSFFAPGQDPVILVPPAAASSCYGGLAIFSVTASNALDYQWQFKGQDMPDENFEDLVLRALPPSDTGNYRVIVRNPLGSVTSLGVPLLIHMPPVINVPPPSFVSQCIGQNITLTATVSGTNLRCQWLRNGNVIPGAMASSLTLSNLVPEAAGFYVLTVSNICGKIASSPVTLEVISPPVIAAQPQPQSRYTGESVYFAVAVNGPGTARYQWRRNGVDVPGGTNQILALPVVQPENAGIYSALVSNPCGLVTSSGALLSVTSEPIGIRIVQAANRQLSIEVLGSVGRQYVLEISDDLRNWTPVGTNWLLLSGTPLFQENADRAARFYRVRPVE